MAKALIAVLFATLLVAGLAAETGRTLQQTYDCKSAKKLATTNNACGLLCGCALGLNKALKSEEGRCKTLCEKCKSAAQSADCSKTSGIPKECEEGRNAQPGSKEVNQCINSFVKAQGRH